MKVAVIFLFLVCFASCASAFKILFFIPLLGISHVRFAGKLVDILAQAGHNVTVYQPIVDSSISNKGYTSPNVGYYTRERKPGEFEHFNGESNMWEGLSFKNLQEFSQARYDYCYAIMQENATIAALKAENFDLVVTETFEPCGYGLIQAIGAKKYVSTGSGGIHSDTMASFGVHRHLSYAPEMMSSNTEKMTFVERLQNVFTYVMTEAVAKKMLWGSAANAIRTRIPDFDLNSAIGKSAFFFVNSEDHVDYIIPRTPKVIPIPNMDNAKPKPLTKEFAKIVEAPTTRAIVLFSFGSVLKACDMPAHVKEAFLGAFSEFSDITFFWKYEKPEDGTAADIPNVYINKWLPQRDLLYHPKMLAFITHGGQNSLNEAASAGVPMLALPVFADQPRNTALLKYRGIGFGLDYKTVTKDAVVTALRELLSNKRYKENAQVISRMIQARPLSTKESFVKHIEFAAEFGDTGTLSAEGTNQSAFVLYSLDVVSFLVFVIVLFVFLAKLLVVSIYRFIKSKFIKTKVE